MLSLVLTACVSKQQLIVSDVDGNKYQLVEKSIKIDTFTATIEKWQRISPPDTNHWYSKTLTSQIYTNLPSTFDRFNR